MQYQLKKKKKQQLELDMEQQTGSKQEKEYLKAVYCHPAYLTYMQSTSRLYIVTLLISYLTYVQKYIMQNARLDEA